MAECARAGKMSSVFNVQSVGLFAINLSIFYLLIGNYWTRYTSHRERCPFGKIAHIYRRWTWPSINNTLNVHRFNGGTFYRTPDGHRLSAKRMRWPELPRLCRACAMFTLAAITPALRRERRRRSKVTDVARLRQLVSFSLFLQRVCFVLLDKNLMVCRCVFKNINRLDAVIGNLILNIRQQMALLALVLCGLELTMTTVARWTNLFVICGTNIGIV